MVICTDLSFFTLVSICFQLIAGVFGLVYYLEIFIILNLNFLIRSSDSSWSFSVSYGKPTIKSVANVIFLTFFIRKSATLENSTIVYSLFIFYKTSSDPLCTGICKNE